MTELSQSAKSSPFLRDVLNGNVLTRNEVGYRHEVCEVLVKKISQELWALLTETHP